MNKKNKNPDLSTLDLNNSTCVWVDDGKKSVTYFCKNMPIKINRRLISELKGVIKKIRDRNVRLCLHSSPEALFHEMIILERKGKYYRPHKHLDKGETFHIIEGMMGVFSFDDNGNITDACVLEPDTNFMYKVKTNMYHAVMPLSDLVIYHESKPGPFTGPRDSIYPFWAPDGSNPKEMAEYIVYLKKALEI